jgi:hypothetical protein
MVLTRARGIIEQVYKQNQRGNLTILTPFSLYNVLRERESADSLFSDLRPVIFNLSPTRWPAVAPPRRSPKPPRTQT